MANAVVRGSLISVGLAWALCALAAQASEAPFVVPGSKAASLESCVEPTEFMRRNHMEVIKHQRNVTVHEGIRSTKYSLAGCVACHVSSGTTGAAIPIDREDQFCGACHEFAAVELDCFDCHATVPHTAPLGAGIPESATGRALNPHALGAVAAHQSQRPELAGEGNRP